jgi:hypothetical protein
MGHQASRVERDGVVYRVEGGPTLPLTFHGGFREKRLARPSADVRTVIPGTQAWGVALLFVCAGAGWASVAWGLLRAGHPGWATAAVVVLSGAFAVFARVAGLSILTDRTRFDRVAGRACRRRLGRTVWSVDLREILAVQCLYAGQQRTSGGWVRAYQVNLVLQAAGDRRAQVCGAGDAVWVRALGRDLAEFLGVPVVDQT